MSQRQRKPPARKLLAETLQLKLQILSLNAIFEIEMSRETVIVSESENANGTTDPSTADTSRTTSVIAIMIADRTKMLAKGTLATCGILEILGIIARRITETLEIATTIHETLETETCAITETLVT